MSEFGYIFAYNSWMQGGIQITLNEDGKSYTVTVQAGITHQWYPGTWHVVHQVLRNGNFVGFIEDSFVIKDACSEMKIKTLKTINGEVISNYLHMQYPLVYPSYLNLYEKVEYLEEIVLTFNDELPVDTESEYIWRSADFNAVVTNWPCPAQVPSFQIDLVKPNAAILVHESPSFGGAISASALTTAPTFRLDAIPVSVQLYSFQFNLLIDKWENQASEAILLDKELVFISAGGDCTKQLAYDTDSLA